jgi:TQXA domain-containing protein
VARNGARLTRYRGGTYSHTVATLTFADGTTARTDLIRLNPNVEAYSLDFGGHAPTRPSHYLAATWSAVTNLAARAHEAEVDWILRNSFPTIGTAELSNRLRAAGHPIGSSNVAEHEAIAATQAAIWFFTNDMQLDDRPRNVPIAVRSTPSAIDFEFDGAHQLGGYTVDVTSKTGASLRLRREDRCSTPMASTFRAANQAASSTCAHTSVSTRPPLSWISTCSGQRAPSSRLTDPCCAPSAADL